ncbi:DnaB-like helicase N-terminal domain-containing protein [Nocardioides sp. LML1-1-1.1]|uniref:DnaB-like helicase N-terminal domain-containing protein n=1 Tax=Nocardioides sp. LML1-1-1.1 TaxID=3135248 RepID=UPI00342AE51B
MTTDGPTPRPPHLHAVAPHQPDEPPYDPAYDNPRDTRTPVQNNAAEQALLGALLTAGTLAPDLRPHLAANDFWRPHHGTIWDAIHTVHDTGTTPDMITVGQHLLATGELQRIGGPGYLQDLMAACPHPGQATTYAAAVRNASRLREVQTLGTRFHQLATTAADETTLTRNIEQAYEDLEHVVTRWGPTTPGTATGFVDLTWLNGGTPPVIDPPTICRHADGHGLFYPGKVNGIFGDPEGGKTWLAQAAIVEQLAADGTAAILDVDHNGADATAARLLLLGARLDVLADPTRFRYYQPDDPAELRAAIDDIVSHTPTVVLIDSIGEAIPMYGANTNDGDEITNAMRFLCTRPADAGSCVITIDHLPKSAEARTTGYAIGSIAKKRMIRGSYLRAEARVQPAPGQIGYVTLRIEKDTAGQLRRAAGGGYAGTLILDSTESETHGITRWAVETQQAPKNDDGTFRPTRQMEAISRYVEDNDQCTQRDIETDVAGKSSIIRAALKLLVHEGFISTLPGPRGARLHHSIALYREAEDDHAQ